MRIFILEDDSMRHQGFREACIGATLTLARSYEEAIEMWHPPYDLVLLDHDLGGKQYVESDGEEKTGYHFVEWLIQQNNIGNTGVVVHSYNPEGARKMVEALIAHNIIADSYPYGINLLRSIKKMTTGRSTNP